MGGVVWLLMRGSKMPLKTGHYWPASEMPFKWWIAGMLMMAQLGSFVIFQGIRNSTAKKPYVFVIFSGGGGLGPPVPPLDLCMTNYVGPQAATFWVPQYQILMHQLQVCDITEIFTTNRLNQVTTFKNIVRSWASKKIFRQLQTCKIIYPAKIAI